MFSVLVDGGYLLDEERKPVHNVAEKVAWYYFLRARNRLTCQIQLIKSGRPVANYGG